MSSDLLAKILAVVIIAALVAVYRLFGKNKRQFIKNAVLWLFLGWIGGLLIFGILYEYCKDDSWTCVLLGS